MSGISFDSPQSSTMSPSRSEHHLKVNTSWITQTFEGLFATKIILEGEKICEYRGKLLNTVQAMKVVDKSYLMRLSCQCYVDAKESSCLARYINDCRNPAGYNVSFDKRSNEGCAYVIANRDIMVGEELFVDYGRWYWLNSKPIRLSFCALQTFRGKADIPHLGGSGSLSYVD